MVLISDEGFPRRVGATDQNGRVSHARGPSTGSIDQAACAARPARTWPTSSRAAAALGCAGPVDAILEDQVLLGERLGLAVVPRRASGARCCTGIRVAREAGGVPPRLAQEPNAPAFPRFPPD